MPQLDFISYLTQYLWFLLLLGIFYYIVTTKIVPTISLIKKARSVSNIADHLTTSGLNTQTPKLALLSFAPPVSASPSVLISNTFQTAAIKWASASDK